MIDIKSIILFIDELLNFTKKSDRIFVDNQSLKIFQFYLKNLPKVVLTHSLKIFFEFSEGFAFRFAKYSSIFFLSRFAL
jgi:hypothetical protein